MEKTLSLPLARRRSARSPLALFSRIVSGLGRVEIREGKGTAAPQEVREATRKMRHAVYCKEKKFLDSGTLLDTYDDRALLLTAHKGHDVIGIMRVTDSAEGPLEIFEMHPELRPLVPAGARLLEWSRLMVLREHRGFSATLPLFRRAFAEVVARRADGIILSCAPRLIPYYRDLLGCRQLAATPLHHARLRGLIDYPMILDWPRALEHATKANLPFWFAINPWLAAKAVCFTGLRLLRERLGGVPPEQTASAP